MAFSTGNGRKSKAKQIISSFSEGSVGSQELQISSVDSPVDKPTNFFSYYEIAIIGGVSYLLQAIIYEQTSAE